MSKKRRIGFVQFHPSYDYTDFVEGLRPINGENGSVGFKLQDGVFTQFIKRARHNYEENKENCDKFVFIIDEINRGEISKIFGELFFSIDPGYRGKAGEVLTQYQNLHDDPNDKFYIPENVYIIGTMNDIDRSVDTFDFAMRRRFRFIEIKPEDSINMLDDLNVKDKAISAMNSLNKAIIETEGLNENYQIGPSYFLKLKEIDFDDLWTDYLKPLLEEYVRGLNDENEIMERFEKVYKGIDNESSEA